MSLKSVLDYRRHMEDAAKADMAATMRELTSHLEVIRSLEEKLGNLLGEIARSQREGTEAGEVLALYRFAETLDSDIAAAQRALAVLNNQKEQHQKIVMTRTRDCRMIELLEGRRDQARVRQEDQREQQSNDEAAIRRWRDASGPCGAR